MGGRGNMNPEDTTCALGGGGSRVISVEQEAGDWLAEIFVISGGWDRGWGMCRTYGAEECHVPCTQRLRTGLTCAAPLVLEEREAAKNFLVVGGWARRRGEILVRLQETAGAKGAKAHWVGQRGRMCRTYGARNRYSPCTQGLRPGLTCFAPPALVVFAGRLLQKTGGTKIAPTVLGRDALRG